MKSANKNYIPGTNPDWGKELPDGYNNSLVDKAGYSWDNGFNFDEKDDEEEFNREEAEKAIEARKNELGQQ